VNTYRRYAVLEGSQPETVAILNDAMMKVNTSQVFVQKMADIGTEARALDVKGAAAYLDATESAYKQAFELGKAQTK
jgi:hypothetical protein